MLGWFQNKIHLSDIRDLSNYISKGLKIILNMGDIGWNEIHEKFPLFFWIIKYPPCYKGGEVLEIVFLYWSSIASLSVSCKNMFWCCRIQSWFCYVESWSGKSRLSFIIWEFFRWTIFTKLFKYLHYFAHWKFF